MGLKWRQLVVLDSAPLFFLSTCCLPFTHASICVHMSVGTRRTTPVKRDAVDGVGQLGFFDNRSPSFGQRDSNLLVSSIVTRFVNEPGYVHSSMRTSGQGGNHGEEWGGLFSLNSLPLMRHLPVCVKRDTVFACCWSNMTVGMKGNVQNQVELLGILMELEREFFGELYTIFFTFNFAVSFILFIYCLFYLYSGTKEGLKLVLVQEQ